MSPFAWAGLVLTLCIVAIAARLYVLIKDVSRLCEALSVLARQGERGNELAAFLLVGLYDQMSREAQSSIPQRLYLWALSVTALARHQPAASTAQEPPDLTELAQQIPPAPPG